MTGVCPLVGEAGPEATAGSLVGGVRDSGAVSCPLVDGAWSCGL